MKKRMLIGFIAATALFCTAGNSFAGEMDLLLQKLVEKGVLSAGEAQTLKTETQEKVKQEIAAGKNESLPSWIQNTKLKGDLRLRYQYKAEKASNNLRKDTNIGRVRMRLGLESKINEKLMAGIGLATNYGGDPRSTNITFGDKNGGYSSKMEVRLDYAYAKYSPFSEVTLLAGKMLLPDVLWEPTDLIWDTDITPEGGVIALKKKLGQTQLFANVGTLFGVADTSTEADPTMMYLAQVGADHKLNDTVSVKGSVALYDWANVQGKAYPTDSWYKSSNTKDLTKWADDYRQLTPALEVSIAEPLKAIGLGIEKLKLFGEYVNNLAVSNDKNTGYSGGFQLGHNKIEKWGDWQFKYIYAMLEKDAVIDVTPDSDRYSGKTGMRSHEGSLALGLSKNTFLGFDVYRSWNINGLPQAPETLVQCDWNMKF